MTGAHRDGPWLGLDIGGSKLLAVGVDQAAAVVVEQRAPTPRDAGAEAVVARCRELLLPLCAQYRPRGLGVGFAGLVDGASGVARSSIMLPGFADYPLAARLAAALDLPVYLDNDANTAALAELAGVGETRGLHMVVLTVGTGIGGAIVIDGRLYRGAGGLAGEFGNTTIDWEGTTCWCGNRGCANMLASGSALGAHAPALAVASRGPAAAAEIVQLAAAGDRAARAAVERTARALGALVANAINTFNPHRVAIGGGLSEVDGLLDLVRQEAAGRAFAAAFAQAEIARAVFGARSSAVGAALLAKDAGAAAEVRR